MIIRQLMLRQGRRALFAPTRRWIRALNTETIEASLEHHIRETQPIEEFVNSQSHVPVQPTDALTSESETEELTTAETWEAIQAQKQTTGPLGSALSHLYRPHELVNNPPSPKDISVESLIAAQAHLGHSTSLWHPGNSRYIFGIRSGIHIIDPSITAAHLRRACRIVSGVTARGGIVLFAGTREGQERCVVKAAELAGGCHLFERWTPGSITNGQQILARCKTKVVDEFDNDVTHLFGDQLMNRSVLKPDLVVCLNPRENYVLLHECGLNGVPTIGIVDTDQDPTWVTYPIPANDDSLRCVQTIAGVLGRAGETGKKARLEAADQGIITFNPAERLRNPGSRSGSESRPSR
ncbi:ribosomal protein S2 [Xylona heveae TC161]|uniref:Ribosomal protein S2 n=1 Tax=Xylona heveae (strain CBS 132557 / TC161) TaxID=1328760 RepID=A0A161TF06_XYLHT|nr:ribosomal protein S2 [Xylona heveae TC161]KZF24557.1 ribosomal protein S2 [Xylona heveae TC161]